jgi:hypothetical protein
MIWVPLLIAFHAFISAAAVLINLLARVAKEILD